MNEVFPAEASDHMMSGKVKSFFTYPLHSISKHNSIP
jgi:hypothetical protein